MIQCIDAFKNLNVVANSSTVSISPCCVSPTKTMSEINFFDNNYLTEIRNSWKNNKWPTACNSCKKAEDQSLVSRRQGSAEWYKDHNHLDTTIELIRLDYWTGDICNLACVICGPHNSSQWKKELKFHTDISHASINKFWERLDLAKLEFIHFNGGEPLLSKEHVNFLESIPDKSKVHLNYNTNGTILPSQHLLDLWEKFKLVQLDFSIDDIGERFEYQRYPAKWDQVANNLKWFVDNCPHNCIFATNTSVGILNNDNIGLLMTWLQQNFYVNNYTDPIEHRTQLTQGLFELKDAEHRKESIIKNLNDCDSRRGTNWKATFPSLVDYLKITK